MKAAVAEILMLFMPSVGQVPTLPIMQSLTFENHNVC